MQVTIQMNDSCKNIQAVMTLIDSFSNDDTGTATANVIGHDHTGTPAKRTRKSKAKEEESFEVDNETEDVELSSDVDVDDVIAALKKVAKATGSAKASLNIMKKFKVKSVHDLDPSKYDKIISICEVAAA